VNEKIAIIRIGAYNIASRSQRYACAKNFFIR
jgi:hypothetical protein